MIEQLPQEDRDTLRAILLRQSEEGVARPLIPLNVDIDGDGIVDAFGLDEAGELVLVSGVDLADTCYRSDGDDRRDEGGEDA